MTKSKPKHTYKIKKPLFPITFSDDEYTDPPPSLKKPHPSKHHQTLKCVKCNKTYTNINYYKSHMKLHIEKKPCKYCKKLISLAHLSFHESICIAQDNSTSKITKYFAPLNSQIPKIL